MISDTLRKRYLQDPLPIRLGGLAADLARVASFSENPKNHVAVSSLIEEGKWCAEWTAPEAPVEIQEVLAEVQISLALWHRAWLSGRPPPQMREEARRWSERLLGLSELVS
jgi:hypothetical protein